MSKTTSEWINLAKLTLSQYRQQHAANCICIPCVNVRMLSSDPIEDKPQPAPKLPTDKPADPRVDGFRDATGGLPKTRGEVI